jgi:hypothetical protein
VSDEKSGFDRIEAALQGIEERLNRLTLGQARLQQSLHAVLRLQTVGGHGGYPEALTWRRFNLASQNEEDGITYALLQEIGDPPLGRFVEIGAGDNGGNSGFLAGELGFEGMMVDRSSKRLSVLFPLTANGRVKLVEAWITAENINDEVSKNGFASEVDVFSLDIDGNDYWVWNALSVCEPRIVIVEFNSLFGPDRSVAVPYDPEFSIPMSGPLKRAYFGASLKAFVGLGRKKGYRLVAVEPTGVNAFFLRTDLAPHIPATEPRAAYRVHGSARNRLQRGFDIWETIEKEGRPLVDLEQESAVEV